MFRSVTTFILLPLTLFAVAASSLAQKPSEVKPPAETASLAEVQNWFVGTLGKYASYKTRFDSVTVSNVRAEGCTFTFTKKEKRESVSSATMGTTKTTSVSKNDITIDLAKVRADGISLEDHIYPELGTIKIWYSGFDLSEGSTDGRIYYIVAKHDAGDAVKTALMQMQRLCKAAN